MVHCASALMPLAAGVHSSGDSDAAFSTVAKVLELQPKHLDARMLEKRSECWDTPFHFTGWDETKTELSDAMYLNLREGWSVQLVRDHLRLAVAVVVPEGGNVRLDGSPRMRWELRWETTPYGKLAAHYLLLSNGNFGELFLPQLAGTKPDPRSGFWLLSRLSQEKYCFLVVVDGRRVLRN